MIVGPAFFRLNLTGMWKLWLVCVLSWGVGMVSAQEISVWGGEPWGADAPGFVEVGNAEEPTGVWSESLLQQPLPTNRWWQNMVLGDGAATCNALPYLVQTHADGLRLCLPERVASADFVLSPFVANWRMSAAGAANFAREVTDFDDLSVTVEWSGAGGVMTSPLVRGMSSVTMDYVGASPEISTIHAILDINGEGLGPAAGSRFEIELNNGTTWVMHTETAVSLSVNGGALSWGADWSGWVRLTALDVPGFASLDAATVDAQIAAVPTGGAVEATVNGDLAELVFHWEINGGAVDGGGVPLMFCLPHHRDGLVEPTESACAVTTIKGEALGVLAASWHMTEALPTIGFEAPGGIPTQLVPPLEAALAADIDFPVTAGDTYFGGKQLAAIARLALIADELGQVAMAAQARANLAAALNPWLAGTNGDPLRYDTDWGGIISTSGGSFGQGLYNDHHFHYGYFLYAAAALAKEDSAWAAEWADEVNQLARNLANPSATDPHYTQARNKDWFVGHSWASGLYTFGDGRNQESSSEAVNAWYGVYLWGLASNQTQIAQLGRLLLATEIRSTQTYWQIDSSDGIYPEPFASRKVVGVLWSTKVDHATFFGGNLEFIHGIQMLPFTPITESLLEPAWVVEEYPVVSEALSSPDIGDGWRGFIYMTHAILDPVAAWDEVMTLNGHDDGNTLTNTLYWIATRPGADAIDPGGVVDEPGVTFHVDMAGEDLVDGGVYISGESIDGWCGTCTPMSDPDGDGVYTVTLDLAPGAVEYKFINGNWDFGEIFDPATDGACTLTTGEFTNRYFVVPADGNAELPVVCFNSCDTCDPLAGCPSDTNNNGICDTDDIPGCTYPDAANFDPAATMDDGSCLSAEPACVGDLNGDGVVSVVDLLALLGVFGDACE